MAATIKFQYRGHSVELWEKSYRIDRGEVVFVGRFGDAERQACEAVDAMHSMTWEQRLARFTDDVRDWAAMRKPPVFGWVYEWTCWIGATYAAFARWGNVNVAAILLVGAMVISTMRKHHRELLELSDEDGTDV